MELNFIYDDLGNIIVDNNNYIVGDIIVLDKEKEYEITFIDYKNNLAYAEYNGNYQEQTFNSKYLKNIIIFSILFILTFTFTSLFLIYQIRHKKHLN